MPSWPFSLPTKVKAGSHQQQPQANAAVFEADVGEPIRRRRYTGKSSTESFVLDLTYVQKERLLEFWNDDCAQGTLTFTATLVDGIFRTWWFEPDNQPQAVNIRGGNAYQVTVQMGCRR